jgi:hypothetical protein
MLLAGLLLAAAPPPTPPPAAPSLPAGVLHYQAHWRLLPAATATLTWSEAGGLRKIQFSADSNPLISLFYPIRDRMTSWYDPASLCTTAVDNDDTEGRRHRLTRIRYLAAQNQLILDETNPTTQPPSVKHEVKPIPGCVMDLFSALDYARAQPLHVGDVYTFPVNEGGTTANVRLTVDLKETVTTPAGRFTAVRTEPTVFDDAVFHRSGQMWVWFSDDARHLPVQVEAKVSWGTILVQLTN